MSKAPREHRKFQQPGKDASPDVLNVGSVEDLGDVEVGSKDHRSIKRMLAGATHLFVSSR